MSEQRVTSCQVTSKYHSQTAQEAARLLTQKLAGLISRELASAKLAQKQDIRDSE